MLPSGESRQLPEAEICVQSFHKLSTAWNHIPNEEENWLKRNLEAQIPICKQQKINLRTPEGYNLGGRVESRFLETLKNINEHGHCTNRMLDSVDWCRKQLEAGKSNERRFPWHFTRRLCIFFQQCMLFLSWLISPWVQTRSSFCSQLSATRYKIFYWHLQHLNFWFVCMWYLQPQTGDSKFIQLPKEGVT